MDATLLTVSIAFTSGFVTTAILMYRHYRKQLENLDGNWTRVPDDDGVRTYVRAYNSSRNVRTALDAVNECQRRPSSPSPGADGPSGDGATAARPTPFRLTIDATGVHADTAERIRRCIMPELRSRNPADVLADMGVERDNYWQALHDYLEEPLDREDIRRALAGGVEGEPLPMPPAPNMGGVGNPQYEGPSYVKREDVADQLKRQGHFGSLPRGEEA